MLKRPVGTSGRASGLAVSWHTRDAGGRRSQRGVAMSVMREEVAVGRVAADLAAGARAWPVYWSAVWVGALAAVAMVLPFGLLGIALGAYVGVPMRGYPSWRDFGLGTMIMSVFGAFLAFAVGGWI